MAKKYKDSHASREAKKYDNPIASRELLLKILKKNKGPMRLREFISVLEYDGDEMAITALKRRLRAMERDGQVITNRQRAYLPVEKADVTVGEVLGHRDGFGFLLPDNGTDDIFLSPYQMRGLWHGDRAAVRVVGKDNRGRPEGSVVEVLRRAQSEIVGHFEQTAGIAYVRPDNPKMSHDVLVSPDDSMGAEQGQIVKIEIVQHPTPRAQAIGRVVEVLGEHMAPGMEIEIAVNNHGLPYRWPAAVEAQIAGLSEEVDETDKQDRVDIRKMALVTIDGEDSRDFDDAVHAKQTKDGWTLTVAIADVSHYVEVDTPLDEEAVHRSTSVYFPSRVIPMLPEVLSNGLCSLNPEVDRLCMVCEIQFNLRGEITDYRFYEGLMYSHARLTYTQVWGVLSGATPDARTQSSDAINENLDALYALYKVLAKARKKRGAIEFETRETKMHFNDEGKIDSIYPYSRNDAHKLIEECMISANVCAAKFLEANKIPALYRVHKGLKENKLDDLQATIGRMGVNIDIMRKPSGVKFNEVLAQFEGRPEYEMVMISILRTLNQAEYTPNNGGHFGLALSHYAHFTSPIRRYPDLLVHRGIRHALQNPEKGVKKTLRHTFKKNSVKGFAYNLERMQYFGKHCSSLERRAEDASRDVESWLKCEYMLEHVGETYHGRVSGVAGFGLFIELEEVFVEGLVHVSSLPKDYYKFDNLMHRMVGENSRREYNLGDRVEVQVASVNLDDRKIDLVLAGADAEVKEIAPKSASKKRKRRKRSEG